MSPCMRQDHLVHVLATCRASCDAEHEAVFSHAHVLTTSQRS